MRNKDILTKMQSLLRGYPRKKWDARPSFKKKIANGLVRTRCLGNSVHKDNKSYLSGDQDSNDYADHLSYRGVALIGNLHGHHGWEDHSYFPEMSAADPHFDARLEVLEKDHADLDVVLISFTLTAIRTIKLVEVDEKSRSRRSVQIVWRCPNLRGVLATIPHRGRTGGTDHSTPSSAQISRRDTW